MKRYVRVTDDVFAQLEAQLPLERGDDGTPTVGDFVNTDLVKIVEHFTEGWDSLVPRFVGRDDYRIYWGTGLVVYSVSGQLAPDGWIELIDIEIDLHGLEEPAIE